MRATVKFDGVSAHNLRFILATVSEAQTGRDNRAECVVTLEGPEMFTVKVPALPAAIMATIFETIFATPEWERDLLGLN